jgi:hypothetical protein
MNDEMKVSQHPIHSPAVDGKGDEPSLLVMALLEQLQVDRAHGRFYDLADYYAANPELEDEFLAMALAAPWDNEGDGSVSSSPEREGGIVVRRPLSPGTLRALASIPEFASDIEVAQESRVAESRAPYAADEER